MDAWRKPPRETSYPDLDAMAARLCRANPRLAPERAAFLAEHVTRRREDGGFTWAYDPMHRAPFPTVHRFAEWAACYRRVEAPVLWIGAGLNRWMSQDEVARRRALLARSAHIHCTGAGHNLHHEIPESIAPRIEAFMTTGVLPENETIA
jgi:pimeloyl-ACP methyl ester carboxylesterase